MHGTAQFALRSWPWYPQRVVTCNQPGPTLPAVLFPQVHVKERLDGYRATHGLAAASEWKVGADLACAFQTDAPGKSV